MSRCHPGDNIGDPEERLVRWTGELVLFKEVAGSAVFDENSPILAIVVGSTALYHQPSDPLIGQPGDDPREAVGTSTSLDSPRCGRQGGNSGRPRQGRHGVDDVIPAFRPLVPPMNSALAGEPQALHLPAARGVVDRNDDGGEEEQPWTPTAQALVQKCCPCHEHRLSDSVTRCADHKSLWLGGSIAVGLRIVSRSAITPTPRPRAVAPLPRSSGSDHVRARCLSTGVICTEARCLTLPS